MLSSHAPSGILSSFFFFFLLSLCDAINPPIARVPFPCRVFIDSKVASVPRPDAKVAMVAFCRCHAGTEVIGSPSPRHRARHHRESGLTLISANYRRQDATGAMTQLVVESLEIVPLVPSGSAASAPDSWGRSCRLPVEPTVGMITVPRVARLDDAFR